MNLAVIGCGKIGLPLAVQAALRGVNVTGIDINPVVAAMINRGESPVGEPSVERSLKGVVKKKLLIATTDLKNGTKDADAVIVLIPVLLDAAKGADLTAMKELALRLGKCIKPGAVVSFETTLPVGTTSHILRPLLESNGLKADVDFYLVYSPERVKSLSITQQLNKNPKIIAGFGPASLKKGIEIYKQIIDAELIALDSLEKAEMVKLAGMIYRDVNIALANELARYCQNFGVDFNEIAAHANSDGESNLLSAGIGVGGHCTPVYPYFLFKDAREKGAPQSLAEQARRINDAQPEFMVSSLERSAGGSLKGFKILILGLGFRPGVKEDSNSPAYLVEQALKKRGAEIFLYDPLYHKDEINQRGFAYADLGGDSPIDAVILITAHPEFISLDWAKLKERGVRFFADGRDCLEEKVVTQNGIIYLGVGRGSGHKEREGICCP